MTDPTKQAQAATAKTAREVIAEAVKTVEEWARPHTLKQLAANPSGHFAMARSALALRALLDAPEGGVERLVEAGERVRVVHEKRDEEDGGPRVCVPECCGCAFNAALAALREGPESVGGAGMSEADLLDAQSEKIAILTSSRDACRKERDDIRTTLDGTRTALGSGPLEHVTDAAQRVVAERDALKADLAAARGEVERMRTEIAGDSHACANGTVRPYPSVVCSLCVSRGITPPPATEAPISERAGAVLVSTVRIYLGDGGVWRIEDAGPLKCEPAWGIDDASICVRLPGRVAAAAERVAKGGAGA